MDGKGTSPADSTSAAPDLRKGEKMGWVGGWAGAFIWVLALAVIWLWQGRLFSAIAAVLVLAVVVALIVLLAPWRRPATPYYKLMIPLYGVFFAMLAWALSSFGGFAVSGMRIWHMVWIVPCLIPFLTMGGRRWTDGQ